MTKVSSTYLFHILGALSPVLRVLASKSSMYKHAIMGHTDDPMVFH